MQFTYCYTLQMIEEKKDQRQLEHDYAVRFIDFMIEQQTQITNKQQKPIVQCGVEFVDI